MPKPTLPAVIPAQVTEAQKQAPEIGLEALEMVAKSFEISDDDDYRRAGEILIQLARHKKRWEQGDLQAKWGGWNAIIQSANATVALLRQCRDGVSGRIDALRSVYEAKMSAYRIEQDRLTKERALKLAKLAGEMKARAEEESTALLIQGDVAGSQAVLAQADLLPSAPVLPDSYARISGVAQVPEYIVEITDLMALVKAVAEGKVPLRGIVMKKEVDLFEPRLSLIRAERAAAGENFAWPGVKVTEKISYRPKSK